MTPSNHCPCGQRHPWRVVSGARKRAVLTGDERDRFVERRPTRSGAIHREVRVPDRHATEEDESVRR